MDQESRADREPKMILDQIPATAETASDLELIIARQNLARENFTRLARRQRRQSRCRGARCQICGEVGKLGKELPFHSSFGTNPALGIRAALGDPLAHHFCRHWTIFLSVRSNDPIHRVPFPALSIVRSLMNSQLDCAQITSSGRILTLPPSRIADIPVRSNVPVRAPTQQPARQ